MMVATFGERVIVALLGAFAMVFAVVTTRRSDAFRPRDDLKLQAWRYPRPPRAHARGIVARVPAAVRRVIPPMIIGAWLAAGEAAQGRVPAGCLGWGGDLDRIKAVVRRPRPLAARGEGRHRAARRHELSERHVLTYVGFYGFLGFLLAEHLRDGPLRTASLASLAGMAGAGGAEPNPAGPPLDDRRRGVLPCSGWRTSSRLSSCNRMQSGGDEPAHTRHLELESRRG
jgi:hypothetical protein